MLEYLKDTQRSDLPHLQGMRQEKLSDSVQLDAATRRNLEIDLNLSRAARSTRSLASWRRTVTAMGTRHLRRWLNRPLNDRYELDARLAAVQSLTEQFAFETIRKALAPVGDLERILGRVSLGSARPRDLTRLADTLTALPAIRAACAGAGDLPQKLSLLVNDLNDYPELVDELNRALVENPPVLIRDGGVIADKYDAELDELRNVSKNAGDYLVKIEQEEREATGLSSLKVGYNRVHGYYIEISRSQSEQAPDRYIRRQTLKEC